jgi:hypothetical protein
VEEALKSAVTPSDGAMATWEQAVTFIQEEATKSIRKYLMEQEELSRKAMPVWCMALVSLMGENKFTRRLCSLCVIVYRIRMTEAKFEGEPNARRCTVLRGKRVVGVTELHLVRKA